ncbi:MAG: Gfo/Idh/MocA family oxidoreductase [Oscillospiraceae bacterium]|nr:Gfo/Idh/MocA family oxidoreductase [Oscillospiraceae bacterium]
MGKKLTVAFAGLGNRGKDTYAPTVKLFSDRMEMAAIADIDPAKVEDVAKTYGIPKDRCYTSVEEMLAQPKLADAMFITTQDRQHVKQAVAALRKGYDLLMEKPISPVLDECREIVRVAKETGRKVVICHVLRYTPFYMKLKEILDAGTIGDVVSIMGIENVCYWHQCHSFVRGNWRNSDQTSPMILQKCCHDMDLYLWLANKTCKSVSSYGDTYLFKEENAPEGAALRCMDGCKAKENCPFDAEKIYLTNEDTGILHGHDGWPCEVLAMHPTEEKIREAIRTSPYGRCVFHCDNNVVDHQVVNLEMTDGTTMSFTMCAFTAQGGRYAKFMGTKGDIIADLGKNTIDIGVFGKKRDVIDVSKLAEDFSGHAGGDNQLVREFLDMELDGKVASNITSLERSMESHYIALAAERSRLRDGAVVTLEEMRSDT